jgi:hypothetical protein
MRLDRLAVTHIIHVHEQAAADGDMVRHREDAIGRARVALDLLEDLVRARTTKRATDELLNLVSVSHERMLRQQPRRCKAKPHNENR